MLLLNAPQNVPTVLRRSTGNPMLRSHLPIKSFTWTVWARD